MTKPKNSLFTSVDCDADSWSLEENLKLLQAVCQQIPKSDSIAYNERVEKIRWNQVLMENRTEREAKKQFDGLLSRIRNYRLLSEMLKDIEKAISRELTGKYRYRQNAFSIFLEENKDEFKRKVVNSGKKGAFVSMAAQKYRSLSQEKKNHLIVRAKQQREMYKKYMITKGYQSIQKKKINCKKGPYLNLWEQAKQKNPEITFTNAKKMYSSLNKNQKLKYILQYLKVEDGKKLNMKQYNTAFNTLSRDELGIIENYEGRPKKLSAYNYFTRDYIERNKTDGMSNRSLYFQKMGKIWKNLSDAKRAKYEKLSEGIHQTYTKKYIEYIKSLPADRQTFEINRVLNKDITRKSKKTSNQLKSHLLNGQSQDERENVIKDPQNEAEVLAVFTVNSDFEEPEMVSHKSWLDSLNFSQPSTSAESERETETVNNKKQLSDSPASLIMEISTSQVLKSRSHKSPTSSSKYLRKKSNVHINNLAMKKGKRLLRSSKVHKKS